MSGARLHAADITLIHRARIIHVANEEAHRNWRRVRRQTVNASECDRDALNVGYIRERHQDFVTSMRCRGRADRHDTHISRCSDGAAEPEHNRVAAANDARLDGNGTTDRLQCIDCNASIGKSKGPAMPWDLRDSTATSGSSVTDTKLAGAEQIFVSKNMHIRPYTCDRRFAQPLIAEWLY